MDRRLDPRTIVTPYAFAVHPDLLGRPLATPWQRLGAILVDLVVIGFLSQIGIGPLAIASAALLFWLATRPQARDAIGIAFRIAIGCLGVSIIAVTALIIFLLNSDIVRRAVEDISEDAGIALETTSSESGETPPSAAADAEQGPGGEVGFLDIFQGFRGALDLQQAEDAEEAQALMTEFAEGAYRAGISRSQIRQVLAEIIPDDVGWASDADEILNGVMTGLSESEAEAEPDSEAPAPEASEAMSAEALDSIEVLNRVLRESEDDREDLQRALTRTNEALEQEQDRGFLDMIMGFIDDLGIGFGWGALYLTITHTLWKGTSVGKKFFRIRVVMIDKRPLNWWLSFERAGGYAAGFATGLLGFAQIFWDPNRQAIHDKVSETIVIQDGKDPVPGPWIQEGKDQWGRGRETS